MTSAGRDRGTSGGTWNGTGADRPALGEVDGGELLGEAPEAAGHLGVQGTGGTLDGAGLAASAEMPGGADEGVAGKVRGGGHQGGLGAARVVVPQQRDDRIVPRLDQPGSTPGAHQRDGCEAGVRGQGEHLGAGSLEAPLQLGGEQEVRELGLGVGARRPVGASLAVGVVGLIAPLRWAMEETVTTRPTICASNRVVRAKWPRCLVPN